MAKWKKAFCIALSSMLLMITCFINIPVKAAKLQNQIPEIKYANAPATEYFAGDRIRFDIYAPNYGGRVEYRVILWDDSKKTYYDLWNAENGYPSRYYTKWQPTGNTVFTLGWPIFEPGYYRITVLVKRLGIPNDKTALRGMNCDSYMESVAFLVKPRSAEVDYIQPLGDVTITQGNIPNLPQTVKAVLKDNTERNLRVNWEYADTSVTGIFLIQGSVEGTDKKAVLRLIVNPRTLNVYSVAAANETIVNVILRDPIDYVPDISRFYIIGNNNIPVRIYTLNLSQDRRTVQLITEAMANGQWYKLNIDGKDFSFQIPNPIARKIFIGEIQDMGLEAGKQETVNIYTSPDNAALTVSSSNRGIAAVEIKDRRLIIKGIDAGAATIKLTASKNGYETGSRSFNVIVNKLTAYPDSVNEDRSFDNIFQLEIKGYGDFGRDFSIYDVSLGDDFSGLSVQMPNVLDIQTNRVRIRLTGELVYRKGYGTITLSQRGWIGPNTLTAKVNVNEIAARQQVSKPVAMPEAGDVNPGIQVILYSLTSGAKIYYTTDGTTPTVKSMEFVNPIVINKTTRIKAIAVKTGMKDSEVSTFIYNVKIDTPKPVTLQDGDFRAVQGNVMGKPKDRIYFQRLINRNWQIIGSTNDERTNGQLKGFFALDNTPFAVIDNSKSGLVIVTPGDDSLAAIAGYMDNDGEIQYGEYRAVMGSVIGEARNRIYIQRYYDGRWRTISSTHGSGDNGNLTGFFVLGKTPYAIIQYSDSKDIIVTSSNERLDKVCGIVIWD